MLFLIAYWGFVNRIVVDELEVRNEILAQDQMEIVNEQKSVHTALISSVSQISLFENLVNEQNTMSSLNIIRDLNTIKTAGSFRESMFIYFPQTDLLFSPNTYSSDYMNMLTLNYWMTPEQAESIISHMKDLDFSGPLPETTLQGKRVIPYVYTANEYHKVRTIIFVDVENLLALSGEEKDYSIQVLLNADGDILTQVGIEDTPLTQEQIADIVAGVPNNIANIYGEEYMVEVQTSIESSTTYILLMNEEYLMRQVRYVDNAVIIMIVASVFLFIIVLIYNIRKNYLPISSLGKLSHNILDANSEGDADRDTVKIIEQAIKKLQTDTKNLKESNAEIFDKVGISSKYYFIRTLLDTDYAPSKIQHLMEEFGITFNYQHFSMITVSTNVKKDEKFYVTLIAQQMQTCVDCFFSTEEINSKFVYIINYEDQSVCENELYQVLTKLCNQLKADFDISVVMGVSKSFTELKEVSKAFVEASTALDYRLVYGKEAVIFTDKITKAEISLLKYPYKDIENLRELIKFGTEKQAKEQLNAIFNIIDETTPLYFAKRLAYDVISVLTSYISSINEIENVESIAFYISNFNSIEQLKDKVMMIIQDLFEEYRSTTAHSLIPKIIDYVNEHAYDVDFSVQRVADEFDISIQSLGAKFKKHCGETVMMYQTRLRMEKARELLLTEENYKVADVAKLVGFENHTSFIRRFKQYYNTTPTQITSEIE